MSGRIALTVDKRALETYKLDCDERDTLRQSSQDLIVSSPLDLGLLKFTATMSSMFSIRSESQNMHFRDVIPRGRAMDQRVPPSATQN